MMNFRVKPEKLFETWNAIANLAEKANEVYVKVTAVKQDGFDPSWLRNAVYEPLEEADVLEPEE